MAASHCELGKYCWHPWHNFWNSYPFFGFTILWIFSDLNASQIWLGLLLDNFCTQDCLWISMWYIKFAFSSLELPYTTKLEASREADLKAASVAPPSSKPPQRPKNKKKTSHHSRGASAVASSPLLSLSPFDCFVNAFFCIIQCWPLKLCLSIQCWFFQCCMCKFPIYSLVCFILVILQSSLAYNRNLGIGMLKV